MRRALSRLSASALFLSLSATAFANGRFPRAERLIEDPRDASHLILGATYGMLVSSDGAASWHHVCEASFAQTELQTDPVIALTPDGAILAGIYASIARSAPDACDFQKTLGSSNREAVPDFTLSASVPGRAIGILVSLLEDGGSQSQLYRSDDAGKNWAALGPTLPPSLRVVVTVDIAPSDAERVYVSGLDAAGHGLLLRSNDGGETFAELAIPTDASHDETPYIAAVDPADPDAIYLRTDQWAFDPVAQVANANDALLYSSDGGEHFTELLRRGGKLYGFAFSPDGAQLLVGYGDPVEAGGGRLTEPDALGIYLAPTGSSDFEKRYPGSINCLTWTARGIYACLLEAEAGFSLGLARSTAFERFEPLLRLKDVTGPVACPACTSSAICRNYWQSTCQSWGRTDCVSLIPTTPDSCGGASAPGGDANEAGAEAAGNGGAGTTRPQPRSSGCSCELARSNAARRGAWPWLGALLLLSARARRAARALRSGGSPACRKQTARALAAPRRRAPA